MPQTRRMIGVIGFGYVWRVASGLAAWLRLARRGELKGAGISCAKSVPRAIPRFGAPQLSSSGLTKTSWFVGRRFLHFRQTVNFRPPHIADKGNKILWHCRVGLLDWCPYDSKLSSFPDIAHVIWVNQMIDPNLPSFSSSPLLVPYSPRCVSNVAFWQSCSSRLLHFVLECWQEYVAFAGERAATWPAGLLSEGENLGKINAPPQSLDVYVRVCPCQGNIT